jgi:hypothetical protein
MNDHESERRREVALFRYGLIADLVRLESGSKGLYARIEQKAGGAYTIPGSTCTRVAAETIRDWLKSYRRGGFDALLPKPRADRGQSRSLPPEVVDAPARLHRPPRCCPYQKLNPGSPGEGCRVGRETGVILSEAKVLGW